MTTSIVERHQVYGDLMLRVSDAIRDRNEEVLFSLADESDQIIRDLQNSWADLLARLDAHSSDTDRDRDIRRITQSLEGSLDKLRTTQKELAQWGSELGTSLRAIDQGRNAVRGYAIGQGR